MEVEEAEGRRQERAATKEAGKAGEAAAVFGWLLEKERLQGLLVARLQTLTTRILGRLILAPFCQRLGWEKRRINFGYSASHSTATQAECKWVCTTSSSAQPCSRLAVVPCWNVEIQRRMGAGPMKQKMVLMVPRGSGPAAYYDYDYDYDVELGPPGYLLRSRSPSLCLALMSQDGSVHYDRLPVPQPHPRRTCRVEAAAGPRVHGRAGQGRAGHDRAEQSRAGQARPGRNGIVWLGIEGSAAAASVSRPTVLSGRVVMMAYAPSSTNRCLDSLSMYAATACATECHLQSMLGWARHWLLVRFLFCWLLACAHWPSHPGWPHALLSIRSRMGCRAAQTRLPKPSLCMGVPLPRPVSSPPQTRPVNTWCILLPTTNSPSTPGRQMDTKSNTAIPPANQPASQPAPDRLRLIGRLQLALSAPPWHSWPRPQSANTSMWVPCWDPAHGRLS